MKITEKGKTSLGLSRKALTWRSSSFHFYSTNTATSSSSKSTVMMEPLSGRRNYTTKMGTMLSSPTYTILDTERRFSFHWRIENKDGSLFTLFYLIIWLAHPHLPPKYTFKAAVQANPIKPVKRVGLVKPIPPDLITTLRSMFP